MANHVLGRKIKVKMQVDGEFYDIFCGKTAELPLEQDEIEVTHINSGISREYVPGMSSSTLSVTGVTVSDNEEQRISLLYLAQAAQRRAINTYRVELTDENGDQKSITFSAFVRTATLSKDVASWSQSTVVFRISGDWTFSDVIPPPSEPTCEVQPTLYKTLAEGETSVSDALLIPGVGETITIIGVSRSSYVHYETTGTPGNLEFAYDDSTGTISFDPLNPGNPGGEPVSIEYKIES
jgi:hypothetical protein